MTFPLPLGHQVDLLAGTAWVDITDDVRRSSPLAVTQGRPEQAPQADPGACAPVLNNRHGRYSPRNPLGMYYGQIGRNTPIRVWVPGPLSYLALPGSAGARARVASTTALNISGDLDVRIDARFDLLPPSMPVPTTMELMGRYDTATNNRSWRFLLNSAGALELSWSTTGSDFTTVISTVLPPTLIGRRTALRATLDVNNGSAGRTVTFYTADTLAGPWVQLGDPVTAAGTTSVFNATADLQIGDLSTQTFTPLTGRVYAAEVRNGIDGAAVANPDFTQLAVGTSAFTDGAGRSWTLQAAAEIIRREYRFHGEVSAWPPRWDTSGADRWTPVQAAGILRRLGQGQKALQSTLRRRVPSATPAPLAYWPMEEGEGADQAYSPLDGVKPLTTKGLDFAAEDSMYGSDHLPKVTGGSSISGRVPGAWPGGWHVELVYKLDSAPSTTRTVFRVDVASSVASYVQLRIDTTRIRVEVYDDNDTPLAWFDHTDPAARAAFVGRWNRLQFFTVDNGATTDFVAAWRDVQADTWFYAFTFSSADPGRVTGVRGSWHEDLAGMALGHIAAWDIGGSSGPQPGVRVYDGADDGFTGERAGLRMRRLAAEEGLPVTIAGNPSSTQRMGPQRVATLLELLGEGAEVDGGVLCERRDGLGLLYRTRETLYNQTPVLTLDYTARGEVMPGIEPIDDDARLRNDVTITRDGGSSGRAVLEDGPLSVEPPPAGVGRYDESRTLNCANDEQTSHLAAWAVHLGTWDEQRYPTIEIDLRAAPHLIPGFLALQIGDVLLLRNMPIWSQPGDVTLLLEAVEETIAPESWTATLTCSAAGPWTVAVWDDGRYDIAACELVTDISAGAVSMAVTTTLGPHWTTSASDMPFDVLVGGERMTVTAISGTTTTQTMTVTRAVNGIAKAQTAGTAVALAQPAVRAL